MMSTKIVTDEMVEQALPLFRLRCHEQPRVRPGKWDTYDREAVREILTAALTGVQQLVPCDDAAIERAMEAIIDSDDVIPDGKEPEMVGWALMLAKRALRAAGRLDRV